MILEGTILRGRAFEPVVGRVIVEDGVIDAIEETDGPADRLLVPGFVNAHTHIGDSIAKERGLDLPLEAVVAPPDGLKHRLLRAADRDSLIEEMRRTIRYMASTGTVRFIDFREGGAAGVAALEAAAADGAAEPVILGRNGPAVLEVADGYGASGAADADFTDARRAARAAGKSFMIHAGENSPDDVDPAFALEPDALVHMVHATDRQLDRLAATETPVIVCPRSNAVTGVGFPPIRAMLDRTAVALGTDNVMLNAPSMFREMEFTAKVFDIPPREVLAMATWRGGDLLDRPVGVIDPGAEASIVVLDGASDNLAGIDDPVAGVVRRASATDIIERVTPSSIDEG